MQPVQFVCQLHILLSSDKTWQDLLLRHLLYDVYKMASVPMTEKDINSLNQLRNFQSTLKQLSARYLLISVYLQSIQSIHKLLYSRSHSNVSFGSSGNFVFFIEYWSEFGLKFALLWVGVVYVLADILRSELDGLK
jgi:hypothetical protein